MERRKILTMKQSETQGWEAERAAEREAAEAGSNFLARNSYRPLWSAYLMNLERAFADDSRSLDRRAISAKVT